MQLLAKFKKFLFMGFRATLNFRKLKVALNLTYRNFLMTLPKVIKNKQTRRGSRQRNIYRFVSLLLSHVLSLVDLTFIS